MTSRSRLARARRWRREGVDWCTGSRQLSTRTQGAAVAYTGVGWWSPVAWSFSRGIKYWPETKDIGVVMRMVNRWLDRQRPNRRKPR